MTNINDTKKLLEQERQFLQHEVAAIERRIGAALLRKRLGHPSESANSLRTELIGLEARLSDLTLMLDAVPDVEAELLEQQERESETPFVDNMERLRADYVTAKKAFERGFRSMQNDQPKLLSAAQQLLAKARIARQTNDAKAFLNRYLRQQPILGKAYQQGVQT